MEFNYNINDIFKSPIVEINHSLIPPGYTGDRRALRDVVTKVSDIVNAMGEASAAAQGLTKPVTTADRLRNSEHKLYFLIDKNLNGGKGAVTGMLKTGNKSLYVFDRDGIHYQVAPPCLLDFYIHESRQRNGLGRQLFEYMLQRENVEPVQMAIDRPSEKLLGFFNKHYQLNEPVKQMNNYVVYDGFFPSKEQIAPPEPELDARSVTNCKKNSANGLQAFQAPLGRYGAPRPPCSMGQIIHNQTQMDQRKEPAGVQSLPATNYVGTSYSPQSNSHKTQSTPNMYYGNRYENQESLNQYQSHAFPNQAQMDSSNLQHMNQNSNYQNQNYSYPATNLSHTYSPAPPNMNGYPNHMNGVNYAYQQPVNGQWMISDPIAPDQQYQKANPSVSAARVSNGVDLQVSEQQARFKQSPRSQQVIADRPQGHVHTDAQISAQNSRSPQYTNQQQYLASQPPQITQSEIYQHPQSSYPVQGVHQLQVAQTVPNLSIQQGYTTAMQPTGTYVNQPIQQNVVTDPQETQHISNNQISGTPRQLNPTQALVTPNAVPPQYTSQQLQQDVKYNPSIGPSGNAFDNQRQYASSQNQQIPGSTEQHQPNVPIKHSSSQLASGDFQQSQFVEQHNAVNHANNQNQSNPHHIHNQHNPHQQYYTQQVGPFGDPRQHTHSNTKEDQNQIPSPNLKSGLLTTEIPPDKSHENYMPNRSQVHGDQQVQNPVGMANQNNVQYLQNQQNLESNRVFTTLQSTAHNQAELNKEQNVPNNLPQEGQQNFPHQTFRNHPHPHQEVHNNEQKFTNKENTQELNVKDAYGQNLNTISSQHAGHVHPNYQMLNSSNNNTLNSQNQSSAVPSYAETQQNLREVHPTIPNPYAQANPGFYSQSQQMSSLSNPTERQNAEQFKSAGIHSHHAINLQNIPYYSQQATPFQTQEVAPSSTASELAPIQQTSISPNEIQQNFYNPPTTAVSNQNQLHTYQDHIRNNPSQHHPNYQQQSTIIQQNSGQYVANGNNTGVAQVPMVLQQHSPLLSSAQGDVSANPVGQLEHQLKHQEHVHPGQAGDYVAQPNYTKPIQGSVHKQTKITKSAAEIYKTNAFEPTSISKLAKRHINKITQPSECNLLYGYPPQRNESRIFNAPIPVIRQKS